MFLRFEKDIFSCFSIELTLTALLGIRGGLPQVKAVDTTLRNQTRKKQKMNPGIASYKNTDIGMEMCGTLEVMLH